MLAHASRQPAVWIILDVRRIPTRIPVSDYPDGIDYEWFAVDAVGHIAAFTTGGSGPIPAVALADSETEDALDGFLLRLPVRGCATMLVSLPRPDDFIAFAERGLFAYDWADVHRAARNYRGVYEIYSRPTSPISISELPPQFQSLLRQRAFGEMQFDNSAFVDVRALMRCNEPSA